MYRRFDWRDANPAALAEQQCGEPQLKIEQGWQIRYLSCEEVVPAGRPSRPAAMTMATA